MIQDIAAHHQVQPGHKIIQICPCKLCDAVQAVGQGTPVDLEELGSEGAVPFIHEVGL